MVDEMIVEVFSTKVGVTSGSLDLKKPSLTIKRETLKKEEEKPHRVESENVPLAGNPLVKTVCNGGSDRHVDDAKDKATWVRTRLIEMSWLEWREGGRETPTVEIFGFSQKSSSHLQVVRRPNVAPTTSSYISLSDLLFPRTLSLTSMATPVPCLSSRQCITKSESYLATSFAV
jgi:hypothetical protein